jgi:hypothetical protein
MSNSFDFELVAGDHVSEAIAHIDEAVRNLEPQLEKTRKGLQLGGQETLDGLNGYNSRLDIMASTARDNVQFIGDMIPPLKIGRCRLKLPEWGWQVELLGPSVALTQRVNLPRVTKRQLGRL